MKTSTKILLGAIGLAMLGWLGLAIWSGQNVPSFERTSIIGS